MAREASVESGKLLKRRQNKSMHLKLLIKLESSQKKVCNQYWGKDRFLPICYKMKANLLLTWNVLSKIDTICTYLWTILILEICGTISIETTTSMKNKLVRYLLCRVSSKMFGLRSKPLTSKKHHTSWYQTIKHHLWQKLILE